MGKGDMKTRRGKIVAGSYGVRRKKNKKQKRIKASQIATVDAVKAQPADEALSKVESAVAEVVGSTSPPAAEAEQKPAKRKSVPRAKAPKENT